jgi:hypothetical protein
MLITYYLCITNRKRKYIEEKATATLIKQTDIDRHGPKASSNSSQPPDPPRFSLPTTFKKKFTAYYFLKVHLNNFSQIKVKKKSQSSRNQGFAYYFCMVIEGSGGSGSGSIHLSNDPDPDPGGPKTYESDGSEFRSATLL